MNVSSIPESMRAEPRWVLWRLNADQKKIPYQAAHPDKEAKVNDPTTWSDYETAKAAYEAGGVDGVGLPIRPASEGARP